MINELSEFDEAFDRFLDEFNDVLDFFFVLSSNEYEEPEDMETCLVIFLGSKLILVSLDPYLNIILDELLLVLRIAPSGILLTF